MHSENNDCFALRCDELDACSWRKSGVRVDGICPNFLAYEGFMKYLNVSIGIAVFVSLAGCAMGWTRPNTTEAQFYQDRFQCEGQAAQMYPVIMTSVGPGFQTPGRTNCTTYGNQTNCTTMPGSYTPAQQSDANATSRASAVSSCLRSKGYIYKFGN